MNNRKQKLFTDNGMTESRQYTYKHVCVAETHFEVYSRYSV